MVQMLATKINYVTSRTIAIIQSRVTPTDEAMIATAQIGSPLASSRGTGNVFTLLPERCTHTITWKLLIGLEARELTHCFLSVCK